MTLICFTSQKGSPGVTLTALAVAASFPVTNGRRKILLEADCTGGTLALRYQLPTEPGLLTLAAAIRSSQDNELLWQHSQELPGGLSIVTCPDGPDQVYAALSATGRALGRWLEALPDVDVICDVGRLTSNSPTIDFVAEASAVLMVARPNVEQLQPAARRMITLSPVIKHLGWVLIGDTPYGPADVESTYGIPVVGVISDDSRAASKLESGVVSSKLVRSPLVRSAGSLAEVLSDWLRPNGVAPQPEVAQPVESPSPPPDNELANSPAEPVPPVDSSASWSEPETFIERPDAQQVDYLAAQPSPPPTDPSAPYSPQTADEQSMPVPVHGKSGEGQWVAPVQEFEPPATDQAEWTPPVQEFEPPAAGNSSGNPVHNDEPGNSAGPPLPPSSLSLPKAPSQPVETSKLHPLVEFDPPPRAEPPVPVNGNRGPIAEFDDVDGWVVEPTPISEKPETIQESAQPITQWIVEPDTTPATNPSKVSTAIDQVGGNDRQNGAKLRDTKTWQRASPSAGGADAPNGFEQPPSVVGGGHQIDLSDTETGLEEEVSGSSVPNPFPHEKTRRGWATE